SEFQGHGFKIHFRPPPFQDDSAKTGRLCSLIHCDKSILCLPFPPPVTDSPTSRSNVGLTTLISCGTSSRADTRRVRSSVGSPFAASVPYSLQMRAALAVVTSRLTLSSLKRAAIVSRQRLTRSR